MSTLIIMFYSYPRTGNLFSINSGCESIIGVDNLEIGCPFLLFIKEVLK